MIKVIIIFEKRMINKLKFITMKTKFYSLLTAVVLLSLSFNTSAQNILKSIEGVEPLDLDSNSIVNLTEDFLVADGDENVTDVWRIGDADPGTVNGDKWYISIGDYDSDADTYVTVLHGNRQEDDDNNTNSFFLWSPTDSGVPWNVSSPIVTFKVKITDGQDYTRAQAAGNLGIYFWVQIKDDDGYRRAKVRLTSDPVGIYTASNEWWNYTPYGLGAELTDGNWHTYTVNLKDIIQEYRDWAYEDSGDPKAGDPFTFYGILAIETRCIDAEFDDVIVKPETATAIPETTTAVTYTVFPNPSSGNIKINGISNKASVDVYNLAGTKVRSYTGIVDGSINLSGLINGTYFIKILDGNISSTQKLIVK